MAESGRAELTYKMVNILEQVTVNMEKLRDSKFERFSTSSDEYYFLAATAKDIISEAEEFIELLNTKYSTSPIRRSSND